MDGPARPIDIRRAAMALLLTSGGPVSVGEIVDALAVEVGPEAADRKRIADLLRHQVGLGRVRRVDRGVYEIVPGALSRTTAWRCLNWRREHERERLRWRSLYGDGRT